MLNASIVRRTGTWLEETWRLVLTEYKTELARVQVARERSRLMQLSDRELQDLGISRADAIKEASRSYYDIPDNRTES